MWNVVATLTLAIGTCLQAINSLREWSGERRELVQGALAVKDVRDENRAWRHPVVWWRNRRTVADLLAESPGETAAYRTVRATLWGWSLIATGAALAFVGAVLDL
jgi:hypothetical protein